MPTYVFEFQLNATAHVDAASEEQARRRLNTLRRITTIDHRIDTGEAAIRIANIHLADDAEEADLEETLPEQSPAGPLYRAGSGEHQTAFAPLKQPGWTCYEDDSGDNSTWVSPDRELSVEFGPEADAPRIAPLWRIAYRNPDPYRRTENSFAAYFDGHVPSEAIAAFIATLTAPSTRPTDTGNEEH